MRKHFTKILILVLMVAFTLSGCSVLSVNKVKFYSATVATVGDEVITRQDLIDAYDSYGYYYFAYQQGQEEKEALKSTLEYEINRKLLYNYCINTKNYSLDGDDLNEVWNNVFDYFDSLYSNYADKAREELDIETANEAEEESKADSKYSVYTPYKKSGVLNVIEDSNGVVYTITDYKDEDEENDDVAIDIDWTLYDTVVGNKSAASYDEYIEAVWAKYQTTVTEDIYNKCVELAVKDLIYKNRFVRENGKKLSTNPTDVILREVKKRYWNNYESQIIGKLQDEYDEIPNKYSVADILEKYITMVEESQLNYQDIDTYDSAMVGSSAKPSEVYYHPNNNYFYVYNLLLGFNEDQQAFVNRKEKELNKEAFEEWLEDYALTNLRTGDNVVIHDVETGEKVGTTTVDYVYNYVSSHVAGSNAQKVKTFYDAICQYGTDQGMYNVSAPYVDSADNTQMVAAFNEAGVALDEVGVYGNMSGLVLTKYGYHILFYAGKVNPAVYYPALQFSNRNNVTIKDLDDAIIDYRTDKTVFDIVFDAKYGDYASKYENYENGIVNLVSQSVKVNINKDIRDTTLKYN